MFAWSRSANRRTDWKSSAKIATPVGVLVGSPGAPDLLTADLREFFRPLR